MTRESDLLFGLLALQMNFLSKEQLLEAAAVWMGDSKGNLAKLLRDKGHLKDYQAAAVGAMVEAQLRDNGNNPERSLAAAPVDRDVRDAFLGMKPPAEVEKSLAAMRPREDARAAIVAPPSTDRYRLGTEIARGGLGKVVEAFDAGLERDVAVKLVLEDLSPEMAERFEREAKLTGRLEHPNIVPIHDFGTLPGGKRLFLSMKRIRGRDLGKLLAAIAKGDRETRSRFSRARLLSMFQHICLGMAFAHDRGVIHRDLKPANVMVGEYGETLIVDWGLARVMGDSSPQSSMSGGEPRAPGLTMDGDVLGTPAYMSPEQAAGEIQDMDHRSDVYSLGAILYEILSLHPPFDGKTAHEIISKVRSGRITPPSHRVTGSTGEADPNRTLVRAPSTYAGGERIPPELDAICLKAMAFRREDRYGTATELHDELQLFLEGVKERERNHRLADEAVAKAKEAVARRARLREEASVASAEAKKKAGDVKPHEDKAALWAAEDRARELEREGVDAFGDANELLTLALGYERDHAEARRLKAELCWGRFLEAEAAHDEKEMRLSRRMAEEFNDGPLDAQLKGDGTLTVRTRAYRCRCLLDGRRTKTEELGWMGYHPFSGRELSGMRGAEGLPELEPKEPLLLKVHGPDCDPVALEGADVWLFRYEQIERRLYPVTPADVTAAADHPIPSAVLDGCFEAASPYRPRGPGIWLGKTPLEKRPVPMGSYLLVVSHEGRVPIRVPISIPRCGLWEQDVTLFRPEEIPPGAIPIPEGPFGYQGDHGTAYSDPAETKRLDDFFMSRHPITCRDYCAFLNDLAKTRPEEAARRVPRNSEEAGFYWPGPPYAVPTAAWLASAPPEAKAKAKRLPQCPVDWDEDWPIFAVSWEDAMAFAAWSSRREGRPFTLAHEMAWEKAARGTDRRCFPFGDHNDPRWCNLQDSNPAGPRPVRVSEFPGDESPYGVRGLAGNSRDVCLNSPGPLYPGWRLFRGGNWAGMGVNARSASRTGHSKRYVSWYYGGRVVVLCRARGD